MALRVVEPGDAGADGDDTAGRVRVKDVTIWETDETTATYFE